MPAESPIADVAHVIQLSVAPVFLLTSVGTILGVLSTRLGRIVDRARVLADRLETAQGDKRDDYLGELEQLARRRHLVNMAIAFGVGAALLVAGVIAAAFLGFMLHWKASAAIAALFVGAMLCVVVALLLLMREVMTAVLKVRPPR